jgi:hypothetical protein
MDLLRPSSQRAFVASPIRLALLALLAGIALGGPGCDCDGCGPDLTVLPTESPQCRLITERTVSCPQNNQAFRFGKCGPSGCEEDAHCCPGSRCRLDFNACVPNQLDAELQCNDDADCPDNAQRCQQVTLGERAPVLACAYERCAGDSDCGAGRSCFRAGEQGQGVCVETAPCGGGCPSGEVCDVVTSRCAPTRAGSTGCDQACGDSAMLVLTDPDSMSGEICCETQCVCKGLPPIIPTRFGRYSRVALANTEVLVSAYDAHYGDLVVAHYELSGALKHVEFVDGMPLAGDVVADPNGPRGGVAEPGPNVGTHTSIAVDAQDRMRIAYHDVDNRQLKVALQTASGWRTHVIDAPADDGAIVGQFTDVAIDPQSGILYVSYSAREVTGAPGLQGKVTAVKLARSHVTEPQSASDWDVFFVDARPTFDPCAGSCGATQQCVLQDGAAVCANAATACSSCSSLQRCVSVGGGAACRVSAMPPSVTDNPRARGLHTSLTVQGSDVFVAYHDSVAGEVRAALVTSAGPQNPVVIDGNGTGQRRSGDVGRFPAVGFADGELVIVYEDAGRHEVRAWRGASLTSPGSFTIVDGGKQVGEAGKRFVGAGSRFAVDGNGQPLVVYQDASNLDLKLARRGSSGWTHELLLFEGAHGFYADVVTKDGKAYIVSVLAELDGRGRERSRAVLTVRDLP